MRDSHYLAMLLGVAIFGGLMMVAHGNWILAAVLVVAASAVGLILAEELAQEKEGQSGGAA